jgi:cytochrome c peroxidase
VADNLQAAKLGQRLFFDTRLSANGQVACASCHQPQRLFTDGLPRAQGVGTTHHNTMTVVGIAYSPWFFWDGRKDSLWSQALGPLESAVEHGGTRLSYVRLITEDKTYHDAYEALFGPLPDLEDRSRFPEAAGPVADPQRHAAWKAMTTADRETVMAVFVNMGKAIAAYERRILPGPGRFDRYLQALFDNTKTTRQSALSHDEEAGLRLFIGKAQCIRCHNGPLLTNHEFHNTGVPTAPNLPLDHGRMTGVEAAWADPFNCLGTYRDGPRDACAELRFAKRGRALDGAFKTPTLRNVAQTGPYMHTGQFTTLREVLEHYNRAAPGPIGHSELQPLHLAETELAQLEAFLHSLSGPLATPSDWLAPPP